MTAPTGWGRFHERTPSRLLLLLLGVDLAFGGLHVLNERTGFPGVARLNLELDRGYPEMFQYVKFLGAGLLLAVFAVRTPARRYLAWAAIFGYFLLDDALRVHERLGQRAAALLELKPIWGLRPQDFGEILVSALVGALLFLPLSWAHRTGPAHFRKLSQDLALLVILLVLPGVVVDVIHVGIKDRVGELAHFLVGMVEDMGEMFIASVMLWYLFLMFRRGFASPAYLCDRARA